MAIALNITTSSSKGVLLHQLLHGYSSGHRLIESSFRPEDDISRLMLRLSDLSGISMMTGFEEYLTGYPLPSLDSFALAKTWPALEMPRPGCVWTHTIVIKNQDLSKIKDLQTLIGVFSRPTSVSKGEYADGIELNLTEPGVCAANLKSTQELGTQRILKSFYENPNTGILVPAGSAKDFENAIFQIWSQQWPSLRSALTFCTGSLSSRTYGDRPFDIQCVPQLLLHQVVSDTSAASERSILVDSTNDEMPDDWSAIATQDARIVFGGSLREFLWKTTASDNGRKDFIGLVEIFQLLRQSKPIAEILSLISKNFGKKSEGSLLKEALFGPTESERTHNWSEYDILLSLGTTEIYESFDADSLCLRERGQRFPKENPEMSRKLLNELFRSSNPLGELILDGLISGLNAGTARYIIAEQPHFLPAIFRANPNLACYPELWEAAGHNRWELLESLPSGDDIDSELIGKVVGAILSSHSDQFELIRRAIVKWGQPAIFGALDWIDDHKGEMTDACRRALTYEDRLVADWVDRKRSKSLAGIIAAAHIVGPFSYNLLDKDTSSWREAFHRLRSEPNNLEAIYFGTLLLALALGNSPPDALALITETFELIHNFFETAYKHSKFDRIAHESWVIMDPLVPHLHFVFEWDKCERLRRGLVDSFIKHQWPAVELNKCIRDLDVFLAIIKSARRVDGGSYYFRELERPRY